MFNNAKSIYFKGNEVKFITRTRDGAILYQVTPKVSKDVIDIPVTIIWNDNNNADGNRPEQVTVHLYASGFEVSEATLSASNGWTHTFENFPQYDFYADEIEIFYSLTIDSVIFYNDIINTDIINNFSITMNYNPETVNVTVHKIWNDDNDIQGARPESIRMTLNNGMTALLKENNGWTANIEGLPTRLNGESFTYDWSEEEVLGYSLESKTKTENLTTFTNKIVRPDDPGGKPPKT